MELTPVQTTIAITVALIPFLSVAGLLSFDALLKRRHSDRQEDWP